MNRLMVLFFSIVCSVPSLAQVPTHEAAQDGNAESVIHVRTAIGHVSLLEFKGPVTAAAAGSKSFHIERFENKVLITPLKTGVSTNLFVWTATQRFSYELDAPGAPPGVSLAIDAPAPEKKPSADIEQQHTLLSAQTFPAGVSDVRRINSSGIKPSKDAVAIRVDQVIQTSETLYIYFTISNQSKQPFRLVEPTIYRLEPAHSPISLLSFLNCQIDPKWVPRLGSTKYVSVPISRAEFPVGDVSPGTQKAGVIAIQLAPKSPTVMQLVAADGLRATFVF